jgi:hypothetical protein
MPLILATLESEIRRIIVENHALANKLRHHISKKTITKRSSGIVRYLPSEHEALSSNPTATKIKLCLLFVPGSGTELLKPLEYPNQ